MKRRNKMLIDDYKDANATCELHVALRELGVELRRWDGQYECHHILNGGIGCKVEAWDNLISLCRPCHSYCHAHPQEGRVAAWSVKAAKNELDTNLLFRVTGKHVRGVLDGYRLAGKFEQMRVKLLKEMEAECSRLC